MPRAPFDFSGPPTQPRSAPPSSSNRPAGGGDANGGHETGRAPSSEAEAWRQFQTRHQDLASDREAVGAAARTYIEAAQRRGASAEEIRSGLVDGTAEVLRQGAEPRRMVDQVRDRVAEWDVDRTGGQFGGQESGSMRISTSAPKETSFHQELAEFQDRMWRK
jgi:hypothetical protein